jgi:hypothetical protein
VTLPFLLPSGSIITSDYPIQTYIFCISLRPSCICLKGRFVNRPLSFPRRRRIHSWRATLRCGRYGRRVRRPPLSFPRRRESTSKSYPLYSVSYSTPTGSNKSCKSCLNDFLCVFAPLREAQIIFALFRFPFSILSIPAILYPHPDPHNQIFPPYRNFLCAPLCFRVENFIQR